MSINRLRNLDIKDKGEEDLVQEILNLKLLVAPVERPINLGSDKTDFKNVSDELAFQKTIDDRVSSAKTKVDPRVGDSFSPTPEIQQEIPQPSESSLKSKIAKLKKQKKSLTT